MAPQTSARPKVEWETQFSLLMDIYDQGRTLETNAKVAAIMKFLSLARPTVAKQVSWAWLSKGNQADTIVRVLRWGLDQYRDQKSFLRSGPVIEGLYPMPSVDESNFRDGIVWDKARNEAVRVGSKNPIHEFLTRVFELMSKITPWLRACQRQECRRLFIYQRPKQVYCSDVCAQRVRMERFLQRRSTGS
jgi:hypothetical protein